MAATDARQDDDFVIIARTDARTTFGLDEALRRGKAYEEAGADVIFIESPEGVEELEAVNKAFPNTPTLANMIEEEVGPCGPRFGLADRITSPLGQWDRRHVSQCPNDRGREVTAYQGFLNTQMGQLGQLGHPDWDKRVIVRFIRGCLPAWSRFRASGWPRALILRAKASWWTGGRR